VIWYLGARTWKIGIWANDGKRKKEEWPVHGSGSGRDLVETLRRGDSIGVLARTLVNLRVLEMLNCC
jgi:hypothetical protein